jgi:GDP-mannose transporter
MREAGAVALLLGSGIINTLLNKHISMSTKRAMFFIMFIQVLVSLAFLCIFLHFREGKVSIEYDSFRKAFPVSFFFVAMIYSGLKALELLPISMATILKNGTLVIVLVYDVVVNGYVVTSLTFMSLVLISASSVLISLDREGPWKEESRKNRIWGLLWMGANCMATAAYTINLNKFSKEARNPVEASIYINLFAIPLIFLGTVCSGRPAVDLNIFCWIALSGVSSTLVSYSYSLASEMFTSTTMTVIGAMNKLPISLSGMCTGLESATSPLKWVAIIVGSFSAGLYAYSRTN